MDDTLSITTPENVELAYDLAGIGSRFIAVLVDSLIQGVVVLGVTIGAYVLVSFLVDSVSGVDAQTLDTVMTALFAGVLLFLFALIWGYFILFETIWNGQTPGKRLTGLRVIKDNGYPITLLDAIIRNLVRIVDFLPYAYSIGVAVMFLNHRSRRLGDFAAGTLVVKERAPIDLGSLGGGTPRGVAYRPAFKVKAMVKQYEPTVPDSPLPLDAGGEDDEIVLPAVEVLLPNLERLTADEYTVIREYLRQRRDIEWQKSQELGRRLAVAIARRLDYEIPDLRGATGFLEQVMRESQGIREAT